VSAADIGFNGSLFVLLCIFILLMTHNPWRQPPKYRGRLYVATWRYEDDVSLRFALYSTRQQAYEHLGRVMESSSGPSSSKISVARVEEVDV
jgi:hypothetical protein